MYLGEASSKRRKRIIGGITAALILLFIIGFYQDILNFLGSLYVFFTQVVTGSQRLDEAIPLSSLTSDWILLFNCVIGFFFVFFFWLVLLASQAVLPVDGFVEAYRTSFHLLLHMLRLHGPAVFVKDGKVLLTKEDKRVGPGVAVVDFNSAIVLEERVPPPGISRILYNTAHTALMMLGLAEKAETPRAVGPGIVFTRRGEQIRGAVDLRKQFRAQPGVTAYTRDGIEVKSRVWSIFTIGQDPDIVQVSYEGERRPENLRVVIMEPVPEGHFRITGLSDELDRHDRDEIHRFAMAAEHSDELKPYSPLEDPNTLPTFNRERVFGAVFSEARGDNDQLLPWVELPARVSASIFREMLSQVNYDQLYSLGLPGPVPLPRYKTRLRNAMRNNGLLSFRLIAHRSGQALQLRKVYERAELFVSDIHPLTYPKILRDRGIKVIGAGFGDILPVSDEVYEHRLESWIAKWQSETETVNAEKELEATRKRSRARANAQRDLISSLNGILKQTDLTQEVLAVRIFQALERLASDPKTKDLLPGGTLDVMKTTRDWLMPGDISPAIQPPPLMPIDGDEL